MKQELTQERLKELLDYDPENGVFTWRLDRLNEVKAGKEAGHLNPYGYIVIRVCGSLQRAHRLAFLYMTGMFPVFHVDHIDGNRSNNKWLNLRNCNRSENGQNLKKAQLNNNSSGLLGCYFDKESNKFKAAIGINNTRINLGRFKTAKEAHECYLKAKREIHPFNTI